MTVPFDVTVVGVAVVWVKVVTCVTGAGVNVETLVSVAVVRMVLVCVIVEAGKVLVVTNVVVTDCVTLCVVVTATGVSVTVLKQS